MGLVLQVEEPDTVKWFRHQAGWASEVCSQKEWVTEGAQEGKRRERALRKTKGDRGGSYSPQSGQTPRPAPWPDQTRGVSVIVARISGSQFHLA